MGNDMWTTTLTLSIHHTHTVEYYSALKKKEGNPVICDNMDEPGDIC